MKKISLLCATAMAFVATVPVFAQEKPKPAAAEAAANDSDEIIVTAQRTSQSLQSVPIAVSAFNAEALDKQQIKNASDLQLTLPNVTFSKGNFTGSSFTIRGIGDLCVGTSCDSATAIHINGSPLVSTRLFETEYFDLERVEVLRGPQGTLFGRNATSGVVNFVTAKPDLSGFHASAEGEYGNFNAIKAKGMVNAALGESLGVRVAGFYLKRDGYTKNLFTGNKLDGRDMYALRGSLRFEPGPNTKIDLMGYFFREKDNRMRIQKQLCQRDPTGVLGCLPGKLDFGTLNGNATFTGVLSSSQFFALRGLPTALALGSLYGPDVYANAVNPADVRQVNTDFEPTYYTSEQQYQARLEQDFGQAKLQVTGLLQKNSVESQQDYNLAIANRANYAAALNTMNLFATSGIPTALLPPAPAFVPGSVAYFAPVAAALFPGGPNGQLCTSAPEPNGNGTFGGKRVCGTTPLDFDRSRVSTETHSIEAILSSKLDGRFNFLLGAIYLNSTARDGDYYVNAFSIDYLSSVLGSFTSFSNGLAPSFLATPFFRSNTANASLTSYGVFGEAYFDITEKLKLTAGIRYNNDDKSLTARSTLINFLVPYGSTSDIFAGCTMATGVTTGCTNAFANGFDADPSRAGNQMYQVRRGKFDAETGRVVLDYKISDKNLLYASFSRGYKSGGFNPPLQAVFAVPESFTPEFVTSFEVGTKNTFMDGQLTLNATAFYYKYKQLQLSRIVARTSVNDNVDANIYGLELEGAYRPTKELTVNFGASYLKTKVSQDKFLGNPRDPSGGRADVVILKDITNGANCAVVPNSPGNLAGVTTLVTAINGSVGLAGPAAFPAGSGVSALGAFGICSAIEGQITNPSAGIRVLLSVPTGPLPYAVANEGVLVNIRGNELPLAPKYKFNLGVQYAADMGGVTVTPRADFIVTGESYGNIFNGDINKIKAYSQINAQIQIDGPGKKWFVRGFIQNVTDNNATTGLYVTDQSSGLFTNIFTLEPRRFGIAAGVKF